MLDARGGARRIAALALALALAAGMHGTISAQTPGATGGFSGAPPSGGGVALLTTTAATDPGTLAATLADAGCDVESLALLVEGEWQVYIPGAPALVNQGFAAEIGGNTPFFVRCRPPTAQAVDPRNATYFIDGRSVTLVDGHAEEQAAPGSATMIVTQLSDRQTYDDLTGDGVADAGVVLIHDPGGSGTFYYLAALTGGPGGVTTDSVFLGDRIKIERISATRGQLTVTYLDRGPGVPFASPPTVPVTRVFEVQDGELVDTGARIVLRDDSGGAVTIAAGEEFDIVLEANPSTGYAWEIDPAADAADVVEQVGTPVFVADSSAPGSGGETTFTFRGVAEGSALLRLRYRRPFETGVEPLRTFEVNVTVTP